MDSLNVVIVGVGGQGTLLASKVLGRLAGMLGYDVKVSEVHGMSQRGGSVTTYVRLNRDKVYAPLVEQGGADYVLAFEELEALRALPYVRPGGTIIVNTQHILPMPVISGAAEYPAEILETLRQSAQVVAMDALTAAKTAGTQRAVNTVLLGGLAARLPFDKKVWTDALAASVPPRFAEMNLAAFEAGYTGKAE